MTVIARDEGLSGLFKGASPALLRQCTYTPLTMLLFEPVCALVVPPAGQERPNYAQQLLSAGTAGCLAITVCNPAEVLKTQMQASAGTGADRLSMRDVSREVWQRAGVRGFWSGLQPNLARTFLVNAAELGTYAQAKTELVERGLCSEGSLAQHVSASSIAGSVSALVSTPADVVKTRLMNQAGAKQQAYRGTLHALVDITRTEGLLALYKGFTPILARKLTWCTVFFVAYQRVLLLVQ